MNDDPDYFAMDFMASDELAFHRTEKQMLEPPILRIYLASPLTNNDPEADNDCRLVREVTRRLLEDYDYLGIRFEVYDPAEVTPPGSEHSSEEVYMTDHNRTSNADLVIFHVNCPSTGVGMEAQIAAGATVPRVVVYKKYAKVSRMFLGACSSTLATVQYTSEVDYEAELSRNLPDIAKKTLASAKCRRDFLRQLCEAQLGRKIFKQRIRHGIAIKELASRVDIPEFFLRWLECDEKLAVNITQIQLSRIASSINCRVSMNSSGIPKLSGADTDLASEQKTSLDNLVDFVRSQSNPLPDERVFRLWNDHMNQDQEQTEEALRFRRNAEERIVTQQGWRERYEKLGLY